MTELAHEIESGGVEEKAPYRLDSHPALVQRSLHAGMSIFSGKWKLSILWYLDQRPRRFGELASLLREVTAKVLTYQLRELEAAGLLSRTETVSPRHTEYALTESGIAAMPVLQLLWQWGNWYLRREASSHCAADDTSSNRL
ncbi:MAG TPA: helix-turn-helix domain-containing protein [Thermoanaerobaculia bacterium]|nr:helix-turn-helix domain-containing protein [Thermoanaerobaculia bacterium]